jgi:hypothetical protein
MPMAKGKKSAAKTVAKRKGASKPSRKPQKPKKKTAPPPPAARARAKARPAPAKKSSPAKAAPAPSHKAKSATLKSAAPLKAAPPKATPAKAVPNKTAATKAAPPKAAPPRAPEKKAGPKAVPPPAPATRPSPKPPAESKRARRPRTRLHGDSGITATWFTPENRPRPSSFIPAPPRAEAPSLVAAPPATSDRIVHPADLLAEANIRTFPVRIDIEQTFGRVSIMPRPEFIAIRVGEGLEWDFRYLAGTDAIVDEVVIEFDKPSPFPKNVMKSRKPGSARPHRQVSGPASAGAAGKTFPYRIRCINIVKAEVAMVEATLVVRA